MKRFLLGLEEVTKLTQLESLKLHGNRLTEVTPLAKCGQLTYLHLGNNQLTDLSPLAKLTMLEQLHLNNNPNLTQIEVDKLQKALPKCEIKHNAKE